MESGNQRPNRKLVSFGYRLRDRHDQEQLARPESEEPGPVAPHPLVSQAPPLLVQTGTELAGMIEHLTAAGSFAFDSEFIGESSYEHQLCLVQAATAQQVFLVDPLAGLDLTSLWELVASPGVEKIVLAGQQDFETAVRHTGKPPANITDVQIAAGLIHVDYPLSLARLISQFTGVPLGKGLGFTHWDRRPLSASQVRYAADDVRYLPAARDAIGKELASLGRAGWAREECVSALEQLAFYLPAPETLYLRVRRHDGLGPRQLAILRELAILRDQAARQENLPSRTVMKDEVLLAMARWPARTLNDLKGIRGLPRPVEAEYGPQIVEATARALALPIEQLPPADSSDALAPKGRVDKVLAAINAFCVERSIAPSLVASRKDVGRACLAIGSPAAGELRLFRGWRHELLGDLLAGLLER